MKDPKTTVPIKDVVSGEFHDPAHLALIVTQLDSDETARLGLATVDAGHLILSIMQIASAAMARQTKLSGGPNLEALPRFVLKAAGSEPIDGSSLVSLTLSTKDGLHLGFAIEKSMARDLAAALIRAADEAPGSPVH
jgi:hypothetical protein